MENRQSSDAQRAKRNRAKTKAELEKLRAFYTFMFNKHPEEVWEFETWFGRQTEELEPEAAVAEAAMSFDLSMLGKWKAENKKKTGSFKNHQR